MTDTQGRDAHPDDLPVEGPKKRRGVSLVWAVPVLALLIALGATWQNFSQRGPLIHVWFSNGAGIRANETELRFRDIPVGVVESVDFSDDLRKVVAAIRLEKRIAPYVDKDASFWIVRPEVTTQGVRGLDTVLSGVYIQGAWDDVLAARAEDFQGLDEEPLLTAGEEGTTFTFYSNTSLPSGDTPIYFKGIEVGRVGAGEISKDGQRVEAQAVIRAPYDKLVTDATRFWNVSGFSFTLDSAGARLDFTSIASLLSGGVTFETMAQGGKPLTREMEFELYNDKDKAREGFFLDGDGAPVDLMVIFPDNPPGLAAGAPVEIGGLKVGEVQGISGLVDEERFGDSEVRLLATMRIYPGRVGLGKGAGSAELLDYLDEQVAQGMRAQLTSASLLTGGLKIDLVDVPNATEATIDRDADPFPSLPSAPSKLSDPNETGQGLLQRASELPIEDLMSSAIGFLNAARDLVGNDQLQAAPADLRAALAAIRDVATSDAIRGLPDQVAAIGDDIRSVVGRVDDLLTQLDDQGLSEKVIAAVESITTASDSVPGLVDDARGLLKNASDLPLQDLTDRAGALLASAEKVIDQDSTRAIPAEVNSALDELRQTLASVRAITEGDQVRTLAGELADASQRLNAILARVQDDDVVGNVNTTLGSIDKAAASLPPLTEDARALIAKAQELPLDELSAQISGLIDAAQQILDQDATRAIPADVTAALDQMRQTLAAVRTIAQGEDLNSIPTRVVQLTDQLQAATVKVNEFVSAFDADRTASKITLAIGNVTQAADGLPGLVDQAQSILTDAQNLNLGELSDRASALLDTADQILNQPSTREVPEQLNGTLASLRETLDELREGGAVENTNAALASARRAADAVAQASQNLPALSERISRLADQASTTLAGYDRTSEFSRDLLTAIRTVSAAADSIYRLSRQIERNPNSLIFGR